MKRLISILFVIFQLTITFCTIAYSQSSNLSTLVNERRNMFQELNFNIRTKAQTITHKNCDNYFNDIIRLDDKISDEVHRVDSTLENNARILPVMSSTIETLRTKKDNAMMYFYIILFIGFALTALLIYIGVTFQKLQKKMVFLQADIKDANNNYSRVSDEKLGLQKEMKRKIISFENTLIEINSEIEVLTNENKNLKKKLIRVSNNEENPDVILENRLLKEAIVELEFKKNKYESELEIKKNELEIEIENRKKDKRIIIGSPDETTEIIKKELAKRIDYLENALKTKEIMEGILAKKNSELEIKIKEISENFNQLVTDLEDEKTYNSKLNNKLEFLEEEISDKEAELKDVWSKMSNKVAMPKEKYVSDDVETNILKTLEKLNRLRQADILNETEFSALKDKIINQM